MHETLSEKTSNNNNKKVEEVEVVMRSNGFRPDNMYFPVALDLMD